MRGRKRQFRQLWNPYYVSLLNDGEWRSNLINDCLRDERAQPPVVLQLTFLINVLFCVEQINYKKNQSHWFIFFCAWHLSLGLDLLSHFPSSFILAFSLSSGGEVKWKILIDSTYCASLTLYGTFDEKFGYHFFLEAFSFRQPPTTKGNLVSSLVY